MKVMIKVEKPREMVSESSGTGDRIFRSGNRYLSQNRSIISKLPQTRTLIFNILFILSLAITAVCILEGAGIFSLNGTEWPILSVLSVTILFLISALYILHAGQKEMLIASRSSTFDLGRYVDALEEQIARLKKTQRELASRFRQEKQNARDARQTKAVFLSHLSHDIRTPLNHIIGFSDLISHETFGPLGDRRYLTYIRDIKKSGEALLNSVSDIMELAELESGQRIVSPGEFLIDDMFKVLEHRFLARASRCQIHLEFEYDPRQSFSSDRLGLQRIMENLLDNAIRFTPRGGKVTLAAWQGMDGMVFEVTDTGIGIPNERLKNVFAPFSLEDASVRKEHGGMRLGLAIARAITELNGGEIAIDSRPGMGTTVAVSMPSVPTAPAIENVA